MSTTDQYTWTATGAPNTNFNSIASSNDGTNLFSTVYLGAIYTSNNSGVVWNKALGTDGTSWTNIACSNSGSRVVASAATNGAFNSKIFLSTNTGNTWIPTNSPTQTTGMPIYLINWTSLTLDASGTYLYAIAEYSSGAGGSAIYISTYPFTTWTVIFSLTTNLFFGIITSSSDGKKLAVTYGGNGTHGIYTGTTSDYIAWTWTLQAGASSLLLWRYIASDSTGQNLVATADGSGIYTSINGGVNWNGPVSGTLNFVFNSVASSSSGQYLSATCPSIGMFTSIDYGQTFVKQVYTPGQSWVANACSGDGTKLVAIYQNNPSGGGIFIGVPPLPFVPPPTPVPANTVISATQTLSTANSQYATPITIAFSTYTLTAYIQQLAQALNVSASYIEIISALPGSVKINYKMTVPANSGVDINNLVASINTLNVNQIPAIVNSVSVLWAVPSQAVTSQSQTTQVFPNPTPTPVPISPPSTNVVIINADMKFSGPGTNINTPGLYGYIYGEFVIDLAAALSSASGYNIPSNYLTITSLVSGSIIVGYTITIPIGSTIDVNYLVAIINSLNQTSPSLTTIINTLASLWNIPPSTIIVTSHVNSVTVVPNEGNICFKEGTKILCYHSQGKDVYLPIEQITDTKYIKTYKHGYKKVKFVVKSRLYNSPTSNSNSNSEKSFNKLFKYTKTPENGLIEDLYVTGSHALLYDTITYKQANYMLKLIKEYDIDYPMKIDGKHKLIAYYDDNCEECNEEGFVNVYHIIIDNENGLYKNYGIYANGALAESTDEFTLSRMNKSKNVSIHFGFTTNNRDNNTILNSKTKKNYFEEQMELKQYQQKTFKN